MRIRKAARINRASPEVAGAVIESLCSGLGAAGRRRVLRFLAESIREAAESDNERWAVTLEPGYVRFNVGQTESVVLWSDAVNVLVKGAERLSGTTLSRPYPSAGGSRLLHIPHELVWRVLPQISEQHLDAKALARRRPCTRVVKDAHSPGVVEYLWKELGMPGSPPVPGHYRERRTALKARAGRSGAEQDRRLELLPDLHQTEKHAVRKEQLAQRLFRARLRAVDCRCRVTGIEDKAHLRASHIKPWADCSDSERQDSANGLLLAPHVDHLFDAGYLSFEDDGTLLVSKDLDRGVLEAWGLRDLRKVARFSRKQATYMAYHRRQVFRGE